MKSLVVLLIAFMPVFASAQNSLFRQTKVVAQFEINDGANTLMVFSMPEDGQDHYYLSVGKLALGNEIVQVEVNPVSVLFVYLGDTLEDAQAKLEEIKALCKKPVGETLEVQGSLAVGYPDKDLEAVSVIHQKPILEHKLEFRITRENYILTTYIARSDFNSLAGSLKFYRKLHPKEK